MIVRSGIQRYRAIVGIMQDGRFGHAAIDVGPERTSRISWDTPPDAPTVIILEGV
jgi:hypothetical protein